MKPYDSSKFLLTVQRFSRIYDENLLGRKSEPILVRFLFSIVIDLSTISQNLRESHDFTILLRSTGNQASRSLRSLYCDFHMITGIVAIVTIAALVVSINLLRSPTIVHDRYDRRDRL